jgi:hypothetical protein
MPLKLKPRKEGLLADSLALHQEETFYPHILVKDIHLLVHKAGPYITSYLFDHADLENLGKSTFQYIPEAAGQNLRKGRRPTCQMVYKRPSGCAGRRSGKGGWPGYSEGLRT